MRASIVIIFVTFLVDTVIVLGGGTDKEWVFRICEADRHG
jgi:hypothetical protein